MVLDHLVVQNLNTAEDEVDIDGIIMHGAKALYEKTDEGKDRGIIYNSKNVDEMIDQVERQAKEEAVVLAERWRLEDEARERGDKAEPSKEARTFGFAKIWEADQAGLRELQDVTDEMEMEGAEGDMGELLKHARKRKEAEGDRCAAACVCRTRARAGEEEGAVRQGAGRGVEDGGNAGQEEAEK